MGLIFSRWRKKETSGELLEAVQKDIDALESSQRRNEQMRKKYIGRLLVYSVALYIIAALVFYLKYFPINWRDGVLMSIPLLIFPLIVYGIKMLLHYVFVSRMTKNARLLEELKEKKKNTLEEVMEKETYKTAKELLEKYDPNSDIIKDNRKDSPSTTSAQSPVMAGESTELRRRNVGGVKSQNGSLQKAISVPSLTESPFDGPKRRVSSGVPAESSLIMNSPNIQQKAISLSNLEPSGTQNTAQGSPRPIGPPKPAFPILPRERSAMDKVVEYLVGDGPSNRYALICKQCCSHNGMALKEEFEYIGFRCCYCFFMNPPRKERPTAPKLEDDPLTPGRSRKYPQPRFQRETNEGALKQEPENREGVNEEVSRQKPQESVSNISSNEIKEETPDKDMEVLPDEMAMTK